MADSFQARTWNHVLQFLYVYQQDQTHAPEQSMLGDIWATTWQNQQNECASTQSDQS